MGTGPTPCDDGRAGCVAVSVLDADGQIVQIPLDDATTLVLDDAADRAALATGWTRCARRAAPAGSR